MKKNLIASNKNSSIALARTKNLLNITNKLLANSNSELVDDSWIERLWEWADKNKIPDVEWIANIHYQNQGYREGIPRDKNKLLNIKSMTLYDHYHLTELPKEIGNLLNLTEFNLSNNQVKELPKEITNLTHLTRLYLYDNSFIKLPKEIGKLTNLTGLYLSENRLIKLPTEIGKLKKLTKLFLDFNQLVKIPKEIGNLTYLNQLHLDHNELTKLPKEITNLKKLILITLRGNPNLLLTQKQKEWIKELKNNGCFVPTDDDLLERTDLSLSEPKLDDSWIERLWEWADENEIPDLMYDEEYGDYIGIPRNKLKLINLKSLNIDIYGIVLPKEIGYLINLEELNIFYIKEIPQSIKKLKKLKSLSISGSISIPNFIDSFTELHTLYLFDCYSIPESIVHLTNLDSLSIIFYDCSYSLSNNQKKWIENMEIKGIKPYIDCDIH